MLFPVKSNLVMEELTARAWERDAAPDVPIKFLLKSKLVKEELTARAWERDAARESPMLFPLKSRSVKEELTARALGKRCSTRITNEVVTQIHIS